MHLILLNEQVTTKKKKKLQLVINAAFSANDPVAMRDSRESQLAAVAQFDPNPIQKVCPCQMMQSKCVRGCTGPVEGLIKYFFHWDASRNKEPDLFVMQIYKE